MCLISINNKINCVALCAVFFSLLQFTTSYTWTIILLIASEMSVMMASSSFEPSKIPDINFFLQLNHILLDVRRISSFYRTRYYNYMTKTKVMYLCLT